MAIRDDIIAALAYIKHPATQACLAEHGLFEIGARMEIGDEVTFLDLSKVASPEMYLTGGKTKPFTTTNFAELQAYYKNLFGELAAQAIGADVTFVGISNERDTTSDKHVSFNVTHPLLINDVDETPTYLTFVSEGKWTSDKYNRMQRVSSQYPFFLFPGDEVTEEDFLAHILPLRELAANDTLTSMDSYIGNTLPQASNKAAHSRNVAIGVVVAVDYLCEKFGLPQLSEEHRRAILAAGQLHDSGVVRNFAKIRMPLINGQSALSIATKAAVQLKKDNPDITDFTDDEVAQAICASAVAARGDALYKAASGVPEVGKEIGDIRNYFKAADVHNPIELWRRIMHYSGGADFAKHHDLPDNALISGIGANTAISYIAAIIDMIEGAFGDAKTLDEAVICLAGYGKKIKGDPAYTRALMEGYGSGGSFIERWAAISLAEDGGTRKVLRLHPFVKELDAALMLKALKGDKAAAGNFPQVLTDWGPWKGIDGYESLTTHLEAGGTINGFVANVIAEFPELSDEQFTTDLAALAMKKWKEKRAEMGAVIMTIANTRQTPEQIVASLTSITGGPFLARQNLMDTPLLAFFAGIKTRDVNAHPALAGFSKTRLEELDKLLQNAASLNVQEREEAILKDRRVDRDGAFTNFISVDEADPFNSKAYKIVRSQVSGGGIGGMGGIIDPQDKFDPGKTVKREIEEEASEAAKLAGDGAKQLGKEIVTELSTATHRKLARFQDDKHMKDRGWGYVVNSFGHVTRVEPETAAKLDKLMSITRSTAAEYSGQEVSGLVSYTLREAPKHLLRHHYPHEAIDEMMGFAVELHGKGITADAVWAHYANTFVGEGEQRQRPLAILAERAGLVLDDLRSEFLAAVDNAVKGNDTFHNISVQNYAKAHYHATLNQRYFARSNMALYGKMPIYEAQYQLATTSGEIEAPEEGDTTTPYVPGDIIIHPLLRNERGEIQFKADGKTPVRIENKGHVIKGQAKFDRLYRLNEAGDKYESLNRGYMYWLDEPTNVRPAWDVNKPQAIFPGGAVYKSTTINEIYGMPKGPAVNDYARMTSDGQVICRLNLRLEKQFELLEAAHKQGLPGVAGHLDDLKVLYDLAEEKWPQDREIPRPHRIAPQRVQRVQARVG